MTITGIDTIAPVRIVNGEFSVGCTAIFSTGTGTISNNQTICVRHTTAATISTSKTTTLSIGAVSANFVTTTANTPLYSLGVSKIGSGTGSVATTTPTSPVINCGATCTANFNAGTTIVLRATPSAGSFLSGWTGCDSANGLVCTVASIAVGRAVVANFLPGAATPSSAPTIGTATAGNGLAVITFAAPTNNGGSPILNYTVSCTPGPILADNAAGAAVQPIIVAGLINNTMYTCSVSASNTAGVSPASATVSVTPLASIALAMIGVQSRKTHGTSGSYDLAIDPAQVITGAVSVEPRGGGAGHTIVFQFNGPIVSVGSASSVDAGNTNVGTIAAIATQGNEVAVLLTNVPDNRRARITINNVNGNVLSPQSSVGFLIGDINASGSVSAADISAAKARIGQSTNGSNYRSDFNLAGGISAGDVSIVKARSGRVLP